MAYPHVQCAHTHWHSTLQGIVHMRSPSTLYNVTTEAWTAQARSCMCSRPGQSSDIWL